MSGRVAQGLGFAGIGFALGFAIVIITSEREVSITPDLIAGQVDHQDLGAPSAGSSAADLPPSASSSRLLYDPVPADVLFKNLPGKFVRPQIEYSYGELMSFGPNRTYNRRLIDFTAPGSREFLFAPSKLPISFMINLDHRSDRLNDTIDYFEGKARILRMSAKLHVGNANGNVLSHISLMLAMERFGWPYVLCMEEDGTPDVGWWLTYEALALVRAARGDTGYLQLGPSSAPWGVPIVPGTMFHTAGNLAAAMSILGRRMIPGAHVFLRSMVGVQNIGNNPADNGLVNYGHTGVMIPLQLAVFQRTNEGGELYNANIGGFQKKTYRETFKRGVRPTDQYGSYGNPRRNLPEFMRLIDRNCRVTGVPCESPFMYWRASMGRECLEGCPSGVWGGSAAWVWCSAGCPLDQQPPTRTATPTTAPRLKAAVR